MRYIYKDDGVVKYIKSEHYNATFNRINGEFLRWGKTYDDDPDLCYFGPELLDIEISSGQCSGNCPFCYKSNESSLPNKYMGFDRFKQLFDTLPPTVNQIAFGITDLDSNPDFWRIMEYSKENGVIPNYTCNGKMVDEHVAEKTAELCGAVAVSYYDKNTCHDAVNHFVKAGVTQVNIHFMLAEETINNAHELIDDISTDERLKGLYGLIFLQYKPHGRGISNFTPIMDLNNFNKMLKYAESKQVSYGFDSCTTPIYLKTIENTAEYQQKLIYVEPCESGLFSYYCNADGEFFPCSFMEGEGEWKTGISSDGVNDFVSEIWYHPRIVAWRDKLINSSKSCNCEQSRVCRSCPHYDAITVCKIDKIQLEVI